MMLEYFKNPELTEASKLDEFIRTGDQGYLGKYLFLTGRLTDIINVGGKKFSPYDSMRLIAVTLLMKSLVLGFRKSRWER